MKIVSTSYSTSNEFSNPNKWLQRIDFYTGILDELAIEHEVYSIERINYEGEIQRNAVRYIFLKQKRRVVRFPLRMHRLIKKLQPDVVFVNGFIFPLQIIQLRLTVGKRVKIILLHRAEKPFAGLKRLLQQLADKCVNKYLFVSFTFGDEWIEKGIISNRNKIAEVIQASSVFKPTDKSDARAQLLISATSVYLWVGRLDSNKDPVTVVKAFIRFLEFQPSAKLCMIYQEEELLPQVKFLVESNEKAKEAIRLVGRVPHPYLQSWYSGADYFISGSHYEGSGVAVIEAMSCGCIPVLTSITSFRKITGGGKCGILYEAGNEQDLLNALKQITSRDMQVEKERVLHRFNTEFSFEAIAKKVNDMICISTAQPAIEYAKV